MEHLPAVEPEPEPLKTEEIFEVPNEDEVQKAPEVPPEEHKGPGVAKKKRTYKRDPVEMKAHMDRMRAIAAENRRKKKEAAENNKENQDPIKLTSQTPLQTQQDHGASFSKFMEFYTEAEKYRAQLAHQRQEAEDAAAFRAQARKQNRQRKKEKSRSEPVHPFGIKTRLDSNPGAYIFR